MKKLFTLSAIFCLFMSAACVFADDFDKLENLSTEQKQQLTQIQSSYKYRLNNIEDNIMNYNNKIAQVKQDTNKTREQLSLLISAYERNIESLKNQKKQIESEADNAYKSILTDEQYKQYRAQQITAAEAFSNFLQK